MADDVLLRKENFIPEKAGTKPTGFYYRDEDGKLVNGHPENKIPVAAENGDPTILKLWRFQNEIARLAAVGVKAIDIAKQLGLGYSTVWNALNRNPLVRDRIAELQGKRDASTGDITARVRALQPVALAVLEADLTTNDGEVSRKLRNETARKILEMGGNGPIKKAANLSGVFTAEDLAAINERAALLRGEAKTQVEEADYEDVT